MMKCSSLFILLLLAFYGSSLASSVASDLDPSEKNISLRGRAVAKQRQLQVKCNCNSCTEEVLSTLAGGYSCGSRIDWVVANMDISEVDACSLVAGDEFPSICGGCDPNQCSDDGPQDPTPPYEDAYECGCTSCTEEVWNALAGSPAFTCGSRITWLEQQTAESLLSYGIANGPFDKTTSCQLVSSEFPEICRCNPANCNDVPSTAPPTLTPTVSPTNSPTTKEPTSSPTFSPTKSPTKSPTNSPTNSPTTKEPTSSPTSSPTKSPTKLPTNSPTNSPTTKEPTPSPTSSPTEFPTNLPTISTTSGSSTTAPSFRPTDAPVEPTPPPTNPPTASSSAFCGCDSCTDDVLDTYAGDYKCGARINWVIANTDNSEADSCKLVADEFPSICGPCHSDTCDDSVVTPTPVPPTASPAATPVDDIDWDGDDLTLTHYWDCSGQSCDATTLSPWDSSKYRAPAGYQPQDPNDFGGPSQYGEKLWVTAAIMNIDQGEDDDCCGATPQGGCGKCVLISNPDSLRPDWTVMAMKKNTCGNCRENPHADINVPGFDVLQYSLANICGEPGTGLSKEESTVLGEWYKDFPNVADAGAARCSQLPQEFQKGCNLFSDWGWTGGTTGSARYKVVECPDQFKAHIGSLFDEDGIVDNPAPVDPPVNSPTNGGTVLAMSYNTEYTGYNDGRVPAFGAKILDVNPDVVGVQECQDPYALASASGYSLLSGTGPQNYILYNADRVEALDSGWMDIPRDNYAQRTITWGKFRIRATGSEFWFFNTHLPHNGNAASDSNTHARIGRSLVAKRNDLGGANTPTIVVGDCNPFASSGASEGSFESNLAANGIPKVYEGTGISGGYGGLDKIFASDGDWTTLGASDRGTGSSDHPAIAAELSLN